MTPFKFTPEHQPFEGREVSFELRPLTKPERYDVRASISTNGGVPGSECAHRLLLNNVVGWSGIGDPALPWSRAAMRKAAIDGEATSEDAHWDVWSGEIAAALYVRSIVGPTEKKG
jgi:hypothetical protein